MNRIAAFSLFAILATTLTWSSDAHAVSSGFLKRIVERPLYGTSVQSADFTKSGKAYLSQEMRVNFTSATRFSGKAYSTFKLDGVSYRASYEIHGSINGTSKSITYRTGRRIRADRLPNGLTWCSTSNATLTVYRLKGASGHYILRGPTSDSCGGSSSVELTTRR
ncbi:MAG: hypothetical protein ACI9OJ_005719 [Myxococcota bacterium]|jgi:hypothetical protein